MLRQTHLGSSDAGTTPRDMTLGQAKPGFKGNILAVDPIGVQGSLPEEELERRLLEMGLVEGAEIEVLHQGLIRRDPIAVRINGRATFALRRREAGAVLVVPA